MPFLNSSELERLSSVTTARREMTSWLMLHSEAPNSMSHWAKKPSIHQVTTMLSTSKNVLFPGHNHLLTTGTDDPSLGEARAIIIVSGHQYQWLADGYDLAIGHF